MSTRASIDLICARQVIAHCIGDYMVQISKCWCANTEERGWRMIQHCLHTIISIHTWLFVHRNITGHLPTLLQYSHMHNSKHYVRCFCQLTFHNVFTLMNWLWSSIHCIQLTAKHPEYSRKPLYSITFAYIIV